MPLRRLGTPRAALAPLVVRRGLRSTAARLSDGTSQVPAAPNAAPAAAPGAAAASSSSSSGGFVESLLAQLQPTATGRGARRPSLFSGSMAGELARSAALPPLTGRDAMPKIGPSAGRSVVVNGDVAQAFARLRNVVVQNRVQSSAASQRFHERPGLKRKRLKSQRYRKRFKAGFKRMIQIVLEMKNKGM